LYLLLLFISLESIFEIFMKNLIIVAITLVVFSCSKSADPAPTPVAPTPAPTAAELVKKVWSAGVVQWDGTTQFDKSSSANLVAGYSQFRLDLTSSTAVTLTEFDGKKFTGTYSLSSDAKKLTLSGLTSTEGAPSGTNGVLEFTVLAAPSATSLSLETTATYVKASSKKVKLNLVL
jgi:hypothetical protein